MEKCKALSSVMCSEPTRRETLNAKSLLARLIRLDSQLTRFGTVKTVTKSIKKLKSSRKKRVKITLTTKKTSLKARGG